MKDSYPSIALVRICRLLGFTRQAYYQHFNAEQELGIEHELILSETFVSSHQKSPTCSQ